MKQLAAIQLIGNAAALWLGYYWLSVGEARAGLLVWSALVALFTAALFLWMHGAGLIYARDPYRAPYLAALSRLPALLIAAVVILLLYIAIAWLQDKLNGPAFTVASWLTLKLRKPVKPASAVRVVSVAFWLVRWIVLPVVLMPWVERIASTGFRGLVPPVARASRPAQVKLFRRTWLERALTPALLILAIYVPLKLLAWRPLMSSFGIEMTSFVVRCVVAYLLFAGGLLMLEGMPLFTQRKRAVSP